MTKDSVRVFAPATVANVACAFDVLGFAVNEPGDEVTASFSRTPGVTISSISGDHGVLSTNPLENTAAVAAQALLRAKPLTDRGITLAIDKKMPLGSGLGSSAASSAASVVAVNELLGRPFSKEELVAFAAEGERIACGAAHADNVAPSILGGFVLIRSYAPLDLVKIESPTSLFYSVVHPHFEVRTADARNILRREIALSDAVTQWANIAGLIAGLHRSDYPLIGRSLTDIIVEPQRSVLVPGFNSAKAAALRSGALGFSLSGSGPSVFALSTTLKDAEVISHAIREAFISFGVDSDPYFGKINESGARIV